MGVILGLIIKFPLFSSSGSISFVLCITTMQNAICQPTEVASRRNIVLTTQSTTFVRCLSLVSGNKAFFDKETQVIFKCSPLTCPGIAGCTKCCNTRPKFAKVTSKHQSKNVHVERDIGEHRTRSASKF